jgi:glycosyltransferase involved in cell wall biosynthesis
MVHSMRVVHVIHALNIGGMEQWVVRFCLFLRRRGHYCEVVCLRERGKLADTLERQGIPVTLIKLMPGASSLYPMRLIQHIRQVKPDIIHAHSGVWYKAALAACFSGVPLVYTVHGLNGLSNGGRRLHWRERISSKMTNAIVAVSPAVYDQLCRLYGSKSDDIRLIVNGVADIGGRTDSDLNESWAEDGHLVVGMVARFEPPKDYHTFVLAAMEVSKRMQTTQFVLVGEGPQQREIERLIAQKGAGSYIRVLGYRSDVSAILKRLDVFVLSSLSEGAPIALLEAMSAQRPIVATAVGGIPALLANGECGLLVPPGNVEAMAQAILELLTNKTKAQELARRARERFLQEYTIDRMGERYLELYLRAVRETKRV